MVPRIPDAAGLAKTVVRRYLSLLDAPFSRFFVVSLRIFLAASVASDRFVVAPSPSVAHSALFSDRRLAATWLSVCRHVALFCRHVRRGVFAFLLFRWACSYPVSRLFLPGAAALPFSVRLLASHSGCFCTPRVASRVGRPRRLASPDLASGRVFLRRSCPLASTARAIHGPAWRTVVLGVAPRGRHVCSVRFPFSGSAVGFQMR